MVMVWWKGTKCEGQGEDKSGAQYDRRKRKNDKKKKKKKKNKNEQSPHMAPRGNRPISPLETNLGSAFRPQVRPDWVFMQ